MLLAAGFGAFTAARQSWLQWYPPEFSSCGRDFYGMIASFPLQRAIPMIFKGSGDCTKVDWTFLGGSLANWAFVGFAVFVLVALTLMVKLAAPARQRQVVRLRNTGAGSGLPYAKGAKDSRRTRKNTLK